METEIQIKPITIDFKKDPKDFFKTYLKILCAGSDTLKLSQLELDIMSQVKKIGRFDAYTISKNLDISEAQLNNYKGILRKKGLIVKVKGRLYVINPKINLKDSESSLVIVLNFKPI